MPSITWRYGLACKWYSQITDVKKKYSCAAKYYFNREGGKVKFSNQDDFVVLENPTPIKRNAEFVKIFNTSSTPVSAIIFPQKCACISEKGAEGEGYDIVQIDEPQPAERTRKATAIHVLKWKK